MNKLSTELENDIFRIRFLIDPVASECTALREEILKTLEDKMGSYQQVHFDLAAVKMLDSSGIGLIIGAYNTLKTKGVAFKVVQASSDIAGLLKSMGLDKHFEVLLSTETSEQTPEP